jgi:hypothetical protein
MVVAPNAVALCAEKPYTLQDETAPRSLDAPSLPGLARMLLKAEGVHALPTGAHVHMRRGGGVVGLCNTTSSSLAQALQD